MIFRTVARPFLSTSWSVNTVGDGSAQPGRAGVSHAGNGEGCSSLPGTVPMV